MAGDFNLIAGTAPVSRTLQVGFAVFGKTKLFLSEEI